MSQIHCLIQAGGSAAGQETELEQRLRAHHVAHFPGELDVSWRTVEPGRMFTAGAPSTSAVIACTVDRTTTRSDREAYMRGICDLWTELTACTDHEIVVSMSEPDTFDAADRSDTSEE